ncbi:MAG: c-type cytochrome [Thiobacillus sp.]|jgi:cytochrome c oxidase cbb3-type subunit 3|uniref:c-type cytochrome n=1 Tax=Thiobacillus sp. TaxID=924 RepID=UPI002893A613|nr:c-type cytochrome [Thiobacillus sp.]MDT3705829.1 c-type cytochrome [Thiobacillus sp.]
MLKRLLFAASLLAGLGTSSAMAVPDGAQLYGRNCAACHGENGNGGIGVPLALPSFQAGISDDYLRKTIHLGRPGRVMPAFPALEDAEVDAIVRYVRSWNRGISATYSAERVTGDPAHGRKLFAQYCAACHGAEGEGSKGTGVTFSRPRDLPIMAPALNNPGFLSASTDAMIKATLMRGREGTPMVSFIKQGLKEKDIDDIVSHVRGFENHPLSQEVTTAKVDRPVIAMDSPYDLNTTVENVKRAVNNNNFFYGRVQTLEYGMTSPANENQKQVIVYFCNISLLNQALAIDPRVGMFLPCRISIVETNGKVQVMSVNPAVLSRLFNNSELLRMCDELSKNYTAIMEEATL